MWGAMRYTNAVFAEDEENMPPGWFPHGTERHGFAPGTNSVSLVFATGVTNIRRRGIKSAPEEDALHGMHRMADYLRSPNLGCLIGYSDGTPGILMISWSWPTMAAVGWTKKSIREFLWEHSKIPGEQLRRGGADIWIEADRDPAVRESLKSSIRGRIQRGRKTSSFWSRAADTRPTAIGWRGIRPTSSVESPCSREF